MLKSAVWFITWACRYNCPYCWERQRQRAGELKPEPFFDYQNLADAWNRLEPGVLDITGGEPFLQPGFIPMIKAMSEDISVAITTNLEGDICGFVREIRPERILSMTLSYHPLAGVNLSSFLGKALLLQRKGFRVVVNVVAYPEQMYLIPEMRETFRKYALRFHVDPYSQTPYAPYEFDTVEREYIRGLIDNDRANYLNRDVRPVSCSGGMDHIAVFPDGLAYRCVNDKISGARALGSILDTGFRLIGERTPCADYNKCAGCDRDKVSVC